MRKNLGKRSKIISPQEESTLHVPKLLNTYTEISDELMNRISETLMKDNQNSLFLYDILPQIFACICYEPYGRINSLLNAFFGKFHIILAHNVESCIRCLTFLASRLENSVDPPLAQILSKCIQAVDLSKLTRNEWWSLLEAIFLALKMKQHIELKALESIARVCWDLGYHKLMIMAHMLEISDDEDLPLLVKVLNTETKKELKPDEEEYAAMVFRAINRYLVKTKCSSISKLLKSEYIGDMVKYFYHLNENYNIVSFVENLMELSKHQCFLVVNAVFEQSTLHNTWVFCQIRLKNEKFAQFFLSNSVKNGYANLLKYLIDCQSFIFLTRLVLFVFEVSKSQATGAMLEYLKNQGYHECLSKYQDIMQQEMHERILSAYKYFEGGDKMEEI